MKEVTNVGPLTVATGLPSLLYDLRSFKRRSISLLCRADYSARLADYIVYCINDINKQTNSLLFLQAQTARNSSWVTIYEVSAPDAQSLLVTGLVPFTTYRLRVIASNVVGSSPPSEPCKEFQTIQAPPQHPPRNVTVRAVSATNLRVRWIVSKLILLLFYN